jgi:hypothetical protein
LCAQAARLERAVRRDRGRAKRIADAGIEYTYEPLQAKLPQQPKRIKIADEEE